MARIAHLYRYPIKGLSAQSLDVAEVQENKVLSGDRAWGIIHASSKFDPNSPQWQGKRNFLNLREDEKLGELSSKFTNDNQLEMYRQGRKVVSGDYTQDSGRMVIENFLAAFMPSGARGHARLVPAAEAEHFCDNEEQYVSVINLSSIKDLERVTQMPLDHRRFRGNIYIEDAPAWEEWSWVDKDMRIGSAQFRAVQRITRCHAVNMNPETGKVDGNILRDMQRGFRHTDCGVFLRCTQAGKFGVGDTLEVAGE